MSDIQKHLPPGWVEVPIRDLLAPLDDGRILHHGWSPQCDKEPSQSEEEWGVLKTTAVQSGEYLQEHNKRLPKKLIARPNLEVKEGDLLITCAGPRIRCGVPCLVRRTRPRLMLSGKMYRFRVPNASIEPRFVEAFLITQEAQSAIDRMKTGISDSGLNLTHGRFLPLPVRVAPLNEQRRIVQKIEELFSKLDAGVAALERVKANLKRYRAAVLKAAVEGKLTAAWRAEHPDTEPASQLLERILKERRRKWEEAQLAKYAAAGKDPPKGWREKYKEPASPNPDSSPELPTGWTLATVEQLYRAERPISYGVLQPGRDLADGVPLVRVCDINDGTVSIDQMKKIAPSISAQYQRTLLQGGEVLLTVVGTIGRTAVAPAVLQGANTARAVAVIAIVRPVDPHFIEILLRESSMRARLTKAAHEVARKTLNLEDVRIACLPLAPLPEQRHIVAEVERRLSIVDELEAQVAADLKRAGRLRQSILKRAFAGRLVPQDPNDEPAAKLLERIRESRSDEKETGHDDSPARTSGKAAGRRKMKAGRQRKGNE